MSTAGIFRTCQEIGRGQTSSSQNVTGNCSKDQLFASQIPPLTYPYCLASGATSSVSAKITAQESFYQTNFRSAKKSPLYSRGAIAGCKVRLAMRRGNSPRGEPVRTYALSPDSGRTLILWLRLFSGQEKPGTFTGAFGFRGNRLVSQRGWILTRHPNCITTSM